VSGVVDGGTWHRVFLKQFINEFIVPLNLEDSGPLPQIHWHETL